MKIGSVLLPAILITACSSGSRTPAKAYQDWKDRLTVATGIPFSWDGPCVAKVEEKDGAFAYTMKPTTQCYRMTEPRRWRGLWRNEFEGSQFCSAPSTQCTYNTPGDRIWLDADRKLDGFPHLDARLYAVEFVGRRTLYRGAYGHVGQSDHEMVIDRMISIREVKE